jgi:hypothetical protein
MCILHAAQEDLMIRPALMEADAHPMLLQATHVGAARLGSTQQN